MTEKTNKKNFPKRVLVDDEKLQFSIIRRIDELLHMEKPTSELIRTFSAEFGVTPSTASEIIRAARHGENLKIPRYIYFSKHFHFNLCNFFNPDMKDWDKECVEIDELENLFNRMARVIDYANYSSYTLVRTHVLTDGDLHCVFSQVFLQHYPVDDEGWLRLRQSA